MRRPSNTSKQHLDANGRGVELFGIGLMFVGFACRVLVVVAFGCNCS